MYKQDTIAAIATPPGEGSVAIIRISGLDAENIAKKIFRRAQGANLKLESHHLYHGVIRDPRSAQLLDDVLLAIMRKPRSYTGEDVVEIHCHGGAFVVRRVLELAFAEGARQAEAGEFTKRAFLNGRLDLAQAEAVLDLIRARTDRSAGLALRQASGVLSHWVDELRSELLDILVQIEAAIDFPEEEIEILRRHELVDAATELVNKIYYISNTYEWSRMYREGAKVCICGRPNVGKSSLLNAILGEERVIVTPFAGTTRDVIEESLNLNGLPAILWDTAGIRETDDQIEQIGVGLARGYMEKADAVLIVLDGSEPLMPDDKLLLDITRKQKALIVINKNDLSGAAIERDIQQMVGLNNICRVSAKTGDGISKLKENLRLLLLDSVAESPVVITNARHRSALERSERALRRAVASLREGYAPEFVAIDLSDAREALEEITGVISNEDILDRIFSDFCIGK